MFHREAYVLCERLQVAFDSFGFVVKCVCVCVRALALVAEVRASVESFSSESAQACLRLKRAVFYFLLSLFFRPLFLCNTVGVVSSSSLLSDAFCLKVYHV